MSRIFSWPKAWPETGATGLLKDEPEDFCVEEIPLEQPSGEGEHIYLHVWKRNANTHWVARLIAEAFSVKEQDVSYAGQKDRHAVTTQWFSIYAPKQDRILKEFPFPDEEIKILQQTRHVRKLRRGDLSGNRFRIRLKNLSGPEDYKAAVEKNLESVKTSGVPNYFGLQRFGHDGGNVEKAEFMFGGRRERNRHKKSMYLSAARSWLFNEMIRERIEQHGWGISLAGDVNVSGESVSEFTDATAAMWGRGIPLSSSDVLESEQKIAAGEEVLKDGLEHAGLNQERRSVVSLPAGLEWGWSDTNQLELRFALPAGHYATSVLQEILTVTEAEHRVENQ